MVDDDRPKWTEDRWDLLAERVAVIERQLAQLFASLLPRRASSGGWKGSLQIFATIVVPIGVALITGYFTLRAAGVK